MRKTGSILVGEIVTAFFTGIIRGEVNSLDLFLYDMNPESCANSWFSFLKGTTMAPARRLPVRTYVDQKVCSC
jgi:hypothetical protein